MNQIMKEINFKFTILMVSGQVSNSIKRLRFKCGFGSFFNFFKIREFFRVFYSLQETIDVFQMGKFCLEIPHSAGENIWNCSLTVKLPTKFFINSAEQFFIIVVFHPYFLKTLKILKF
jgi:hypothetical protein